jgi:hypothetical protein
MKALPFTHLHICTLRQAQGIAFAHPVHAFTYPEFLYIGGILKKPALHCCKTGVEVKNRLKVLMRTIRKRCNRNHAGEA